MLTQPGYSRPALLSTIQDLLETLQTNFPGQLIQFGFFTATDDENGTLYNDDLWQWLYRDASNSKDANGNPLLSLADEFDGTRRPRIAFFQEDLAAARAPTAAGVPNYLTPPATTAYTFTPNSTLRLR